MKLADLVSGEPAPAPTATPAPARQKLTDVVSSQPSGEDRALADARKIYADRGNTTGMAALTGATLGFGPSVYAYEKEAEVAATDLYDAATGKQAKYTPEEARKAVLQASHEALAKFGKEHPIGEFSAEMIGGLETPGVGWANDLLKLRKVPALTRALIIGGGLGGASAYGYGQGTPTERAKGVPGGIISGALLGGAGHALGAGLERLAPSASRALEGGARQVRRVLAGSTRDAVEREVAQRALGERAAREQVKTIVQRHDPSGQVLAHNAPEAAGHDITAAEALGPRVVAKARGLARHDTPASEQLVPRVTSRIMETGRRVSRKIAKAAGVDENAIERDFTAANNRRRIDAAPHLNRFYDKGGLDSNELRAIRKTAQFQDAIKEAEPLISADRESAYEMGLSKPKVDPHEAIADRFSEVAGIDDDLVHGNFDAHLQTLQRKASKLYDLWEKQKNVNTPTLRKLLNTPSGKEALKGAIRAILDKRLNPYEMGLPKEEEIDKATQDGAELAPVLTPKAWDYVKRGLDDMLDKERDPITKILDMRKASAQGIADIRAEIQRELTDPAHPWGSAAAAAFEAGGDKIRVKDAFYSAEELLSNRVNDAKFMARYKRMSPPEREALQAGVVAHMRDLARNQRMRPSELLTPLAQDKLRRIFGSATASRIITTIRKQMEPQLSEDIPTAKAYDYALRGMDAMLDRAKARVKSGEIRPDDDSIVKLQKVRDELAVELSNKNRRWGAAGKRALEALGDPRARQKAFDSAEQLMSPSVSDEQFGIRTRSYTPTELEALKAGFARMVRDHSESGKLRLENFLTDASKAKIRRLFGHHGGDALIDEIQTEHDLAKSGQKLVGGALIQRASQGEEEEKAHASAIYHAMMGAVGLGHPGGWKWSMVHWFRAFSIHGEDMMATPEGRALTNKMVELLSLPPSELAAQLHQEGVTPQQMGLVGQVLRAIRSNPTFQRMAETAPARLGGTAGGMVYATDASPTVAPTTTTTPSHAPDTPKPVATPRTTDNAPVSLKDYPPPHAPDEDVETYLKSVLGTDVTITSGYRDPEHNREVGGAEHSAHMKGEAWDFQPHGMSPEDAGMKMARSGMPFDQIEITPTHVHVSFGPSMRHSVIYVGYGARGGEQPSSTASAPPADLSLPF